MTLLERGELKRDYYQRDLSQKEIAEKHRCSRKTVERRMDEYDLPRLPSLIRIDKEDGRTKYRSGGRRIL